jgi:hypothetical protein
MNTQTFKVGDTVKAPKGQLFKIVKIDDNYADVRPLNPADELLPHIGKITLTVTIDQLELAK